MSNMTDHWFDCLCLHSVHNKHHIICWQIQRSKILMPMCISQTHIKWSLHEHACIPQLPLHWHTFGMLTNLDILWTLSKNPLCSTFSIHVQEVIYTQIHHTSVQTFVSHLLRLCVPLSMPPHYTCSRENGIPSDLITCRSILLKQPSRSYYYPT